MSRSDCWSCWACWVYSNYEPHAGLTCSLSQVSEVVGVHGQPQLVLTQQAQQGQRRETVSNEPGGRTANQLVQPEDAPGTAGTAYH